MNSYYSYILLTGTGTDVTLTHSDSTYCESIAPTCETTEGETSGETGDTLNIEIETDLPEVQNEYG